MDKGIMKFQENNEKISLSEFGRYLKKKNRV